MIELQHMIATALIYFLLIWLVTILLKKVFKAINNRNRKEERVLKGIKPINTGEGKQS